MPKMKTNADFEKDWSTNPFRVPYLEKVTINISVGEGGEKLKKAETVLQMITNKKPVLIKAKKSVKDFGIRVGQNMAVKVTVRKKEAEELLKRVLFVTDNRILRRSFDNYGNFSIGINEHIKLPSLTKKGTIEYIPSLGIFGFDCCARIVRRGMRVKNRRKQRSKIGKNHYVSKLEAIYFMQKYFGVEIVEKMEEIFY